MDRPLAGRVALVTGAASGIGRAIAVGVARAGAAVVCADVADESLATTVAAIEAAAGAAIAVVADVSKKSDVKAAVAAGEHKFGRLDGVVACAAIHPRTEPGEIDLDSWQRVMAVNLTGTYLTCRCAVDAMRRAGGGSIVTISSIGAERPSYPASEGYHASKGGVVSLTYAMAVRYGGAGIRVNCIAPGFVDTPMTQIGERSPEAIRQLRSRIPLRRAGVPEDFAGPAVFLLSDASSYITGTLLYVDGGAHSMGSPIPLEELG